MEPVTVGVTIRGTMSKKLRMDRGGGSKVTA